MDELISTNISSGSHRDFALQDKKPGILLAYAPKGTFEDRCLIDRKFIFGRDRCCTLVTNDPKASSRHFQILQKNDKYWLEDLASTNGTYVRGIRIKGQVLLRKQTVIRAGRTILVFLPDATSFLIPDPLESHGIAGRFYAG